MRLKHEGSIQPGACWPLTRYEFYCLCLTLYAIVIKDQIFVDFVVIYVV